jgi:outer membrane protein TolC
MRDKNILKREKIYSLIKSIILNMKSKHFVIVLFIGFTTVFVSIKSAKAQDNIIPEKEQGEYEFSLKQAQEFAVNNSIQTKNAQLEIIKAKKKIWETTAIGLPQINASASYTNMINIPTMLMPDFLTEAVVGVNVNYGLLPPETMEQLPESGSFPVKFGKQHNADASIQLTQLLFNGAYLVGLQASKIFKSLSEQSLEKAEDEIKETIAKTYYLILAAQENKIILDSIFINIKKTENDIKELLNEGFIENADYKQIKLTVSQMENSVFALEQQIIIAQRLLKFQMGIDLDKEIVLTQNLENVLSEDDITNLTYQDFNVENNINYKLLSTQEDLTVLNLKRYKSETLPTLAAFASYKSSAMRDEFDFFGGSGDWYPTTVIGLNLSIPIFSSGMRYSKIQQAQIELDEVRNMKFQVKQGVNLEASQAQIEFDIARNKYISEKENLQLSKEIYKITFEKYKEGVSTSLDLTQAHTQYLQTQSQYFSAVIALLNTKAKLDRLYK